MEVGIAGLSRELIGLTRESAAAATLLIRLCTLWFGVAIGVIAMAIMVGRLRALQHARYTE